MNILTVGVVLIVTGVIVASCFVDDIPRAYRKRACLGREWRVRCPGASKRAIREFLAFFNKVCPWRVKESRVCTSCANRMDSHTPRAAFAQHLEST